MRLLSLLTIGFLSVATLASAQVTLDLHALQALPDLGGRAPARASLAPPPRQAQIVTPRPDASAMTGNSRPQQSAATATPPAESARANPPALPDTIPQTAMITPIAPPPSQGQAPPPPTASAPPPPPVSDTAATSAAPSHAGLRVSFAAGKTDLSPDSVAAIRQLAGTTTGESASFNVLAYAPGSPDDPSTARRISLSRAMAVRSALVANGVPSARIYVRALGEQYGSGPPDRVDVNVAGAAEAPGNAAQATPR